MYVYQTARRLYDGNARGRGNFATVFKQTEVKTQCYCCSVFGRDKNEHRNFRCCDCRFVLFFKFFFFRRGRRFVWWTCAADRSEFSVRLCNVSFTMYYYVPRWSLESWFKNVFVGFVFLLQQQTDPRGVFKCCFPDRSVHALFTDDTCGPVVTCCTRLRAMYNCMCVCVLTFVIFVRTRIVRVKRFKRSPLCRLDAKSHSAASAVPLEDTLPVLWLYTHPHTDIIVIIISSVIIGPRVYTPRSALRVRSSSGRRKSRGNPIGF